MSHTAIRLSLFALLLSASAGQAATLRSLVNEGNERYQVKEYEEALKSYRLAAEQSPDSHFAHFNLGAALYRTGEYTQAIGSFQHAAQMAREAGDAEAEALSRYNLGNSFFRSSEADAQTNPREAIAALENSVESYRQALDLDPNLANAEHNIALARKKMKELLEAMRNLPAGGDSQDNQEQLKEQVEQNLQRQKELTQQREDLERQHQNQQGSEKLQEQAQDLAQQQQDLEQESRDISEQLKQKQQASPQEQQAQQNLEQAAQQQQRASQQLGQQQLQQAGGSQQQAQQKLEDALASLGGNPQEGRQSQQQPQPGASQQQPQQQQLQALEQSPQDILNEERANRKRRRMLMLGAQAKVDKDW
jgi:Ca-activated chloride channel family protein